MPIIHTHRLEDLDEAVDPDHLSKVWHGTVRQALRKQRFPDLHDYLDVHRNLEVFIQNLREDVLSGAYQTRKPDVAATEKGKGLRRLLLIDLDAPRLLATAYLYEADELLRRRTRNHFVRWMDDIDFGVRSVEDAHGILGDFDHRLHGLNVRLNSGKTKILTRQGAEEHFWITENIRLNQCKEKITLLGKKRHTVRWRRAVASFEKKAKGFLRRMASSAKRVGHWEKVYLRYFGLAAFVGSTSMERATREILLGHPSMRGKAIGYLRALGYSPKRMTTIKQLIKSQAGTDLCACLDAVEVATQWEVPNGGRHLSGVRSLLDVVERNLGRGHTPMFVCGLMLRAKYSNSRDLARFVRDNLRRWRHSIWGLRQVAACLPLLDKGDAAWVRDRNLESGAPDAVRVIGSLNQIRQITKFAGDKQIKGYAEWRDKAPYGYSLSRFIIVVRLLTGDLAGPEKQRLLDHVLAQVTDPVFRAHIAATARAQGLTVP